MDISLTVDSCVICGIRAQFDNRGAGIGLGRPETNVVLLEEMWILNTRTETIETAQRRIPDEGDGSAKEESSEEEEENKTTKVIKMLAKVGRKTKVEIPEYKGSVNWEELMD